jgi:DNA-binding NarL/FixJ family response regulator
VETNTKIALVDDHEFFRNGLALAIKRIKFTNLAFEANNGIDFLEKQSRIPADIVLMDIKMHQMGGYETVLEARQRFPGLKIIILTMFDDEENIKRFIDAGVEGYLLKNIDYQDLEFALKAVIEGQNYYSRELMSFFTQQIRNVHLPHKSRINLTSRELEVLRLIYNGFSNKEIASKLFISIRTVTNHRANLGLKTGAKNTAGLISFGIKNQLFA